MKFFTIGYGGRQPQEFLHLLQVHHIKTVVDVRLRPDRASMGVYTQAKSAGKGIQGLLRQGGIDYVSFIELGNLLRDHDHWRERYRLLLERAGDLLTERLRAVAPPFCLLCAEQRVSDCHRQDIAEYLVRRGWEAEHIKGDVVAGKALLSTANRSRQPVKSGFSCDSLVQAGEEKEK